MKKMIALFITLSLFISSFPQNVSASAIESYETSIDGKQVIIRKTDTNKGFIIEILDEYETILQSSEMNVQTGNITQKIYDLKLRSYLVEQYHISQFYDDKINNELPLLKENVQFEPVKRVTRASIPSYNYLSIEPRISNDGLTMWTDGYYYIGMTKMIYSDDVGYLFRTQTVTKDNAKKFTFGPGTAVSTVVGTILGTITGGFTVAVIMSLIAAFVTDLIVSIFINPEIGTKTYHSQYRVRVGEDYTLRYSFCRSETYFWLQNFDVLTNQYYESYEYKGWNHGFPTDNGEAVGVGIENHYYDIVTTRPCT